MTNCPVLIYDSQSRGYEGFHIQGYIAMYFIERQSTFPCRWRRQIPPKHLLNFNGLQGNISKKVEISRNCPLCEN
jgi:hypothetical protein